MPQTTKQLYKCFALFSNFQPSALCIGIYVLRMCRPKNPKPNRPCLIPWYTMVYIHYTCVIHLWRQIKKAFTYEYYDVVWRRMSHHVVEIFCHRLKSWLVLNKMLNTGNFFVKLIFKSHWSADLKNIRTKNLWKM